MKGTITTLFGRAFVLPMVVWRLSLCWSLSMAVSSISHSELLSHVRLFAHSHSSQRTIASLNIDRVEAIEDDDENYGDTSMFQCLYLKSAFASMKNESYHSEIEMK